ncbi:MAG: NUDIX hydrolase [Spirochaetaceae bacterium]|nr:NUDIX hydrolase [Spirochaetaceae bacterium]
MNNPESWIEKSSHEIANCRIFQVRESIRETRDHSKSGPFYLIDAPDWAGIIPVVDTSEGRKFVMIRQYRHGTGKVSVEFPGGIVDPNEDPSMAVARELLEETGYRAEMILPLGDLSPNPAFMTNTFHAFIAESCYLDSCQKLDVHEEIEVLLVPERDAIDMIGGEEYGHALMTATLFFYMRYRGYSD